jgi:hypothetical protein
MKKLIVLIAAFLVVSSVYAADINLGQFPLGKWLDANYDAVWEFSTGNIKILDLSGNVLYNFSEKTVNGFRVFLEGTQPGVTFSCPEAGRSYRFLKPLTNTDVVLEIDRDGKPKYTVTLKKQ